MQRRAGRSHLFPSALTRYDGRGPLGQFDAVIVVDPREDAEVATYEIRIPPAKSPNEATARLVGAER